MSVPDFFVYGEPSRALEVGFLHVETVMARKNVHHGQVRPHKHDQMAQITFWTKGRGRYFVEEKVLDFSAPAISYVPSGVVHGFNVVPEETDAIVVSLADGALAAWDQGNPLSLSEAIMVIAEPGRDARWSRLAEMMRLIAEEYAESGEDSERLIMPLVTAVLLQLGKLRSDHASVAEPPSKILALRLRQAIDQHFRENWSVSRYVQELATTPHLLARASTQAFGTSVKELIGRRRLLEAKRRLLFTVRPVEDIGYEIGLQDAAYFSRFFRRRTGQAPGEWRAAQLAAGFQPPL